MNPGSHRVHDLDPRTGRRRCTIRHAVVTRRRTRRPPDPAPPRPAPLDLPGRPDRRVAARVVDRAARRGRARLAPAGGDRRRRPHPQRGAARGAAGLARPGHDRAGPRPGRRGRARRGLGALALGRAARGPAGADAAHAAAPRPGAAVHPVVRHRGAAEGAARRARRAVPDVPQRALRGPRGGPEADRGDVGVRVHPRRAAAPRGAARRDALHPHRPAPGTGDRLAVDHRRGDDVGRRRTRLHDHERPRVPAHRRDRRGPGGVRAARPGHRRPGAPAGTPCPGLAPGRTGGADR
ncbi:hypothetical protein Ae505Ps2_3099c [Pseudonocardia sp. Ae505_Ps2]|nr:hypothetical protein Ae505Ps2_3099c [Pseudonocardia sp. Ae505_Ps2]